MSPCLAQGQHHGSPTLKGLSLSLENGPADVVIQQSWWSPPSAGGWRYNSDNFFCSWLKELGAGQSLLSSACQPHPSHLPCLLPEVCIFNAGLTMTQSLGAFCNRIQVFCQCCSFSFAMLGNEPFVSAWKKAWTWWACRAELVGGFLQL